VTCEYKGSVVLAYLYSEMRGGVPVPWFRYWLDEARPLTTILDDGTYIRCAGSGTTDFGSVPAEFQSQVGPLEYAIPYIMHDSAFQNRGWWESKDLGATWQYVPKTMHDANDMLLLGAKAITVSAKGYSDLNDAQLGRLWIRREAMYAGVAAGGSSCWDKHLGPFPNDPPPPFDVTYLFDQTPTPTTMPAAQPPQEGTLVP